MQHKDHFMLPPPPYDVIPPLSPFLGWWVVVMLSTFAVGMLSHGAGCM